MHVDPIAMRHGTINDSGANTITEGDKRAILVNAAAIQQNSSVGGHDYYEQESEKNRRECQ